jgi:hypothetical protein
MQWQRCMCQARIKPCTHIRGWMVQGTAGAQRHHHHHHQGADGNNTQSCSFPAKCWGIHMLGIHHSFPTMCKTVRLQDGWTALHYAAVGNSMEVSSMLLDAGAAVNATDKVRSSFLLVKAIAQRLVSRQCACWMCTSI